MIDTTDAINELAALTLADLSRMTGLTWQAWDTGGGIGIPTVVVGHDADGFPEWWIHYGCEDWPTLTLYRGPEDSHGLTFAAPAGWIDPDRRLGVVAEWIRDVALLATEAHRGHNR